MKVALILGVLPLVLLLSSMTSPGVPDASEDNPEELLKLAGFFSKGGDTAKARYYFSKAGELYEADNNPEGLGQVERGMMSLYNANRQYEQAISWANKAIVHFTQSDNEPELIRIYNFLGVKYADLGQMDMALESSHKALRIAEKRKDSIQIAIMLSNIAGSFSGPAGGKKLDYNLRALDYLRTSNDFKAEGYLLNNIGSCYLDAGDYDKAFDFFSRSIECKKKAGDFQGEVFSCNNIAESFLRRHRGEEALPYIRRAVALADSIGDPLSQCVSYETFAGYYRDRGDYGKALEYYQKGLVLSRIIRYRWQEMNTMRNIADTYAGMNDFREALVYYQRYSDLKDTLLEEKQRKAIAEINGKYEALAKERTILLLQAQNKEKSARLANSNALIHGLAGLILVIVVSSAIVFYFYRQKLQVYERLVKKDIDLLETEKACPKLMAEQPVISGELHNQIATGLAALMVNGRRYLDPDITLVDVAKELNTNTTYLSRIINSHFRTNFSQFVNEYRIKDARQMLIDEQFGHLSIEGIARSTGFNSKSAFNAAFKKITGVTPSFYQTSARQVIQQKAPEARSSRDQEGRNYPDMAKDLVLEPDRAAT